MYYKTNKDELFFEPTTEVIEKYELIEITETEFNQLLNPEKSLDEVKALKISEINIWKTQQESSTTATVTALENQWDADPTSRAKLDSYLSVSYVPSYWTDSNNVDQVVTLEDMQAIQIAILEWLFTIHDKQRTMKADIAALTSVDDVMAYAIE